mmetsp:Transcript_38723/g.152901  ORF Transcript_38723/g.152901 Transcript_38723/m.152901 type:complete len:96 (+) Transcript_38723:4260-4547(+)
MRLQHRTPPWTSLNFSLFTMTGWKHLLTMHRHATYAPNYPQLMACVRHHLSCNARADLVEFPGEPDLSLLWTTLILQKHIDFRIRPSMSSITGSS